MDGNMNMKADDTIVSFLNCELCEFFAVTKASLDEHTKLHHKTHSHQQAKFNCSSGASNVNKNTPEVSNNQPQDSPF